LLVQKAQQRNSLRGPLGTFSFGLNLAHSPHNQQAKRKQLAKRGDRTTVTKVKVHFSGDCICELRACIKSRANATGSRASFSLSAAVPYIQTNENIEKRQRTNERAVIKQTGSHSGVLRWLLRSLSS
jgi:hypothetical protein